MRHMGAMVLQLVMACYTVCDLCLETATKQLSRITRDTNLQEPVPVALFDQTDASRTMQPYLAAL